MIFQSDLQLFVVGLARPAVAERIVSLQECMRKCRDSAPGVCEKVAALRDGGKQYSITENCVRAVGVSVVGSGRVMPLGTCQRMTAMSNRWTHLVQQDANVVALVASVVRMAYLSQLSVCRLDFVFVRVVVDL